MTENNFDKEVGQIESRMNRRSSLHQDLYNPLKLDVVARRQELERKLIKILNGKFLNKIKNVKLLEIGCGSGINLLKFIELGICPENIIGNELLEERLTQAEKILPSAVNIIPGNALELELKNNSFDIVFQSTVFTSILDDNFKIALAKKIWSLTKPGGGILWYDFTFDNPRNKDVKGIPLKEIRELFPEGKVSYWKLTLAPPIGRIITKIHPSLYDVLNVFPFLRTHILCWIEKKH